MAPSGQNPVTQTSVQAQVIADSFRSAFAAKKLGDCSVEMTAPTETTQAGAQAMQHITLKSANGLSLVIGRVNAVEKKATMRTYYAVGRLFQDRYKKKPPFEQPAYDEMLATTRSLLGAAGVAVELTDSTGQEPGLDLTRGYRAPSYEDKSDRKMWPWIAGGAVLVIGVGALVYALASGSKQPEPDPLGSSTPSSSAAP